MRFDKKKVCKSKIKMLRLIINISMYFLGLDIYFYRN